MPKKKSKLKWTKKLPTVDGFYWWRYGTKDKAPDNLTVKNGRAKGKPPGFAKGISGKLTEWEGQWYGPIPSKEPT